MFCYKAGVYSKVESQGEVNVTLYGGEQATFRLNHCHVRDNNSTNESIRQIQLNSSYITNTTDIHCLGYKEVTGMKILSGEVDSIA